MDVFYPFNWFRYFPDIMYHLFTGGFPHKGEDSISSMSITQIEDPYGDEDADVAVDYGEGIVSSAHYTRDDGEGY